MLLELVAVFVTVVWLVEADFVVDVLCAGGFGLVVVVRGPAWVVAVVAVVVALVSDPAWDVSELDLALPPQAATVRASKQRPAVPARPRVHAASQGPDTRMATDR
ncbi:MAG: hypothetical protein ACLQA5_23820 [Solirubrobacteraceae bacterium]